MPGYTEYDPAAGRNLTYDEWDMKELAGLGVKKEDIEAVSVKKGFFGTLSEAKTIPRIAKEMRYKRLILVSSPYHTRRVWVSFSRYVKDEDGLYLYIYPSDDNTFLRWLLLEYLKLFVYEGVLIK